MANEKRLIDANALKERAIRASTVKSLGGKEHCYIKAVGTHEIDKAPTVDAVEVVRCKDCKHLKYGYQCYRPLGMMLNNDGDAYVLVDEDDFCSCGEMREGGENA